MAGNTLTGLIPTIYTALDVVSREQVGFIPAVAKNAKADAAAKDQTVTAPVAPEAKTEDIVPGPSAPNTGDQNIGTVDVKITKSKMAPVKWNGEEQLALGPSGTYNTILADQFKQAFRALANEVEADLGALYFGASRAVGTAGTTPFGVKDDLSDAALARQVLEDNGAPTTDLQMVLGSTAIANLRGKQSVLFKVNESGTEQLLREGVLGRLEGFNIHSSAGVKRAPKVAATGYLVNGEKKEGDVLISIDTGSGSISAGQIVTFAGDPNQYGFNWNEDSIKRCEEDFRKKIDLSEKRIQWSYESIIKSFNNHYNGDKNAYSWMLGDNLIVMNKTILKQFKRTIVYRGLRKALRIVRNYI